MASNAGVAPAPLVSVLPSADRSPPMRLGPYTFKPADTADEVEQVHRLNYETFVREIPQHADPGDGRLVDRFHEQNLYIVAKRADRVVGMVSAHAGPPFSVAQKLADPTVLERLGGRVLEVRLLAVGPAERNGMVFAGLGWCLQHHARRSGYAHIVISGLRERIRLYERMGFSPLGPAVQSGDAWFIPMAVQVGKGPEKIRSLVDRFGLRVRGATEIKGTTLLTPGPVAVGADVRRAFVRPPIYHRAPAFIAAFEDVRRRLADLVGGSEVALLCGGGTLANDTVAATLAADPDAGPGIVLVNGEFGRRLGTQALCAGLSFRTLAWDWGRPWDLHAIRSALEGSPKTGWVWGVHLESSTGMLNDLGGLVRLAGERGVRVCADCISSVGAVPLDLTGVHLASGASGKSLGSYAGVSFVVAGPRALVGVRRTHVPASLDAGAAMETCGPRFTFASPPVAALHEALRAYASGEQRVKRFERYRRLGAMVRTGLRAAGIEPVSPEFAAAPVLTSFACPRGMASAEFVGLCHGWGFEIGGLSPYLVERRWAQIATMGSVGERRLRLLLERLRREA